VVLDESVEVGQLVEPGPTIATLVGTDEFWVRASIPIEMLKWIRLPDGREDSGYRQTGAHARIFLETGDEQPIVREGAVVRLLSDLEPVGRMARVLIRVSDPLSLAASSRDMPLLLGSFVRVEIEAGELEDVVEIDRKALRGDDRIWVVDPEDRLQIRRVEVLWTRRDSVLISNVLQPEERLIVSGLRLAIPGMMVSPQPVSTSVPASTHKLGQSASAP
jgi:multidrug efflux pump subunit AcrA (membrane-fusion protein)